MTTGVAGWVVVLSEAQQAQQEGCKMINTRREGLSRRQGYPRLCSALRMYMRGKIQFENSGAAILHQITKTEGKKGAHTFLPPALADTFVPINDCRQICSQDSWVMSFPGDQWEETQIWITAVGSEWLTAETAARLPQQDGVWWHWPPRLKKSN